MFSGSMPALVTPFHNGALDIETLKKLVEWHIGEGSNGFVPVGTTGESPTLTHEEHETVVHEVVKATAAKNEEFLLAMLDTDEGARYLGEFAFGTNSGIQRFTKNILFDEKIGGTIHLALGKGYPESGSKNKSAIHWDMVCDLRRGGRITADGELISENGKFLNGQWPQG